MAAVVVKMRGEGRAVGAALGGARQHVLRGLKRMDARSR